MVIIKQRYKKNKIKKVISFFFISKRTFSLFRIQSAPENNKKKKKKISQATQKSHKFRNAEKI